MEIEITHLSGDPFSETCGVTVSSLISGIWSLSTVFHLFSLGSLFPSIGSKIWTGALNSPRQEIFHWVTGLGSTSLRPPTTPATCPPLNLPYHPHHKVTNDPATLSPHHGRRPCYLRPPLLIVFLWPIIKIMVAGNTHLVTPPEKHSLCIPRPTGRLTRLGFSSSSLGPDLNVSSNVSPHLQSSTYNELAFH